MDQTVRDGKIHIKKQLRYSKVGSEMKSCGKNKKCRENENKRFIGITITVRIKYVTINTYTSTLYLKPSNK